MSLFLRRHGESSSPEAGWTPTDEVFKDPVTDRIMRVWADQSGSATAPRSREYRR